MSARMCGHFEGMREVRVSGLALIARRLLFGVRNSNDRRQDTRVTSLSFCVRGTFPRRRHQIDLRYTTMSSVETYRSGSLVSENRAYDASAGSRVSSNCRESRLTRLRAILSCFAGRFEFAAEQHRAQLRESGDPYLSHPLEVAHILADMKLDITTLCAALLARCSGRHPHFLGANRGAFGEDIARLVEGVTKISRLDCWLPRRGRPKMSAKCSWPWSTTFASLS